MGKSQSTAITKNYIHESNLIEGIDDPVMDEAAMEAWNYLKASVRKANKKSLNHTVIQETQRRMISPAKGLARLWAGTYRDRSRTKVTVNGKTTVPPEQVQVAMDDWLENIWPNASPMESHIAFERIHPFIDGNGRVGRMLYWLKEQELGLRPMLFTADNKDEYYKWFN